jgi:hypothetical protein
MDCRRLGLNNLCRRFAEFRKVLMDVGHCLLVLGVETYKTIDLFLQYSKSLLLFEEIFLRPLKVEENYDSRS